MAKTAIWVLSLRSSFDRMLEIWFFTVPSDMYSLLAMSLLESPSAISPAMSISLSVNGRDKYFISGYILVNKEQKEKCY